jgi:hypothetical protein
LLEEEKRLFPTGKSFFSFEDFLNYLLGSFQTEKRRKWLHTIVVFFFQRSSVATGFVCDDKYWLEKEKIGVFGKKRFFSSCRALRHCN